MAEPTAFNLIKRLADSLAENCTDYVVNPQFYPEVAEARAYLAAHPEPVAGPTDEEWEAIKERAWDQFRTVGYQGEQFIYDRDFDTALDGVRQALSRHGHQPPQPIPLSERQPTEADCDAEGKCWFHAFQLGDYDYDWGWKLLDRTHGISWSGGHWLPHWALPVPQQEEG